jgi:hypothetical protein
MVAGSADSLESLYKNKRFVWEGQRKNCGNPVRINSVRAEN